MRKNCEKKQTLENQALDEFLYAFTLMRKNPPPRPANLPLPTPLQKPRFFYTFTHKRNKRNKMRKIFENQGFEAFRKSFRMLFASFSQN